MKDNNEFVTEVTENVEEQATEETVEGVEEPIEEKIYTEAEFNNRMDELLAKKIKRKEAKIRKEYEEKYAPYREAEYVLNSGLGTSNITEATDSMKQFYKERGIEIPHYQEASLSESDIKVLADSEAENIIELGFDDVVEEVDRLAEKGVDKMNSKEKHIFAKLAEYRKAEEGRRELAAIGVKEDALNDKAYLDFEKNLNPNLSAKEKYELYLKIKPKPQIEPIGSMKGRDTSKNTVKDFYSYEEARKFTKADFDKNPALWKAVNDSMPKW